jgi:ABC-type polysaccharide/polyol phosphate export permease
MGSTERRASAGLDDDARSAGDRELPGTAWIGAADDPWPSYDSARQAPPFAEEARQLWARRDLVVQLVRRDIVTRYKRSVLGVLWTLLNPLGTMAVLAVVFSRAFGIGQSYPVYVLSGLLAWSFFAQTTLTAMRQLMSGGPMIRRIYVPRTVFAVVATGTGLVNLVLSLLPLAVIMAVTGVPLRPAVLCLPVGILALAAFTLGVALALSVLSVYFTDAAELYGIVLPAMLYLTPIIYPAQILPEAARPWLVDANPLHHLVSLFRTPLYEGRLPEASSAAVALVVALVVLLAGWAVFTARAGDVAARI